ncbi:MAG: mercury transporter [Clostridia bacterium]|jgi:hypothetical protein|nr:mercury transporter [Clostridia bacterium]NDO19236.1 mercury transporter [Lachnospiraceae bacterium MD329]
MNTMMDIVGLLSVLIRIGVTARVVICLIKINAGGDDSGENKQKIKNALIFLVISECVWVIKDLIFSYYNINIGI